MLCRVSSAVARAQARRLYSSTTPVIAQAEAASAGKATGVLARTQSFVNGGFVSWVCAFALGAGFGTLVNNAYAESAPPAPTMQEIAQLEASMALLTGSVAALGNEFAAIRALEHHAVRAEDVNAVYKSMSDMKHQVEDRLADINKAVLQAKAAQSELKATLADRSLDMALSKLANATPEEVARAFAAQREALQAQQAQLEDTQTHLQKIGKSA
ncbi:hypothetical protein H696_05800 [Fonticula alba]|uniref:Uncharacterized protein n=1 Tax=Fonticula alba TaxID=691883 RepID=A0A058Z0A7_FONAL|nr:hypothetical protein H696_05800 [Fonticula alba]KCV67690.1 hypothetical protein H696_05800 [Fonticula alba]|eukprot:XP_009497874.1 hypothetical protein H696_05800 [Fonticula alba]